MAMNFGTALEALKSGETISRGSGHVAYRRSGAHVMRLKDEDGVIVSTVAQAFGMAEVLSEDWLITGYAQKGIENAGTQEELALGDSGEPAPEEVRDVFVEGAHIGVGAGAPAELSFDEQQELERMMDQEDALEEEEAQPGINPAQTNTNSQEASKAERERMMRERNLSPPSETAPLGIRELHKIITLMSKDTPDSHTLFGMMGQRFTVGGLRSLFPGVRKTLRD